MNKISEILENIKERLNNPFFLAFIISWIGWNWEVTVALIWYDPTQIANAGSKSLFDFISSHTDNWHSIYFPLISAFVFTTGLRLGLTALNDLITKWSEKLSLTILKNSSIPTEKYLKIKSEYESRTKELETVIKDESKLLEKNIELTSDKIKLEKEVLEWKGRLASSKEELSKQIQENNESLKKLQERHDSASKIQEDYYKSKIDFIKDPTELIGTWLLTYENISPAKQKYIVILPSRGLSSYSSIVAPNPELEVIYYELHIFFQDDVDPKLKLFVAVDDISYNNKIYYYLLKETNGLMRGFENNNRISIQRIKVSIAER